MGDVAGGKRAEFGHPTYAACFKCIGPECEDICCVDWDIPVDRKTYQRYVLFPVEKLGREVSEFVAAEPQPQPDALFARIHRNGSGACPFLGGDRLCRIQTSYGQTLLPSSCSIYPRSLALVDRRLEGSLSLSCPEAARSVLLDPDFHRRTGDLHAGEFRTDNVFSLAGQKLAISEAEFIGIRSELISAIKDRARSLRCRVLSVGDFCRELDAAVSPGDLQSAVERLRRRVSTREQGRYAGADTALKVKIAFDLSEARLNEGCSSRFEETFLWFAQGLSSGSGRSNHVGAFEFAEREFYAPYFEQHPYILENYLVNYMFQNLFPFGREGSADFARKDVWGEYLQMAVQFSWLRGLLVGVAGYYKEAFDSGHVIRVIQSVTRAIEHYPDVLASLGMYLRRHGLDSVEGIARLL